QSRNKTNTSQIFLTNGFLWVLRGRIRVVNYFFSWGEGTGMEAHGAGRRAQKEKIQDTRKIKERGPGT
ncbi:MAG TPA: hypothetical protein P5510_11150, partial [Clostridia bacterium]|nr:hypothetical protein [Clostridia bacterium]